GARRATAGRVAIDAVLVSHGAGTRGSSRRSLPARPTPTLPRTRGREQQRVRPASTPSPACGERPGWGAHRRRALDDASICPCPPPPPPPPAGGGGSTSASARPPLRPPLAGKGRDGGRPAGARRMARASALPPPQPSPARGGGSNSACDLLPLLPPLAGKGRDGGRTAGARWM